MQATTKKQEFDQSVLKLTGELKDLLKCEELKFESDCCPLKIEDVVINMQLDPPYGRIILSGYLTDLPQVADRTLLEELLTGNLYWQAGATICLEPVSRSVLMLLAEPVHSLAAANLLSILRQFSKDVRQLRATIEAYKDKPGSNRHAAG